MFTKVFGPKTSALSLFWLMTLKEHIMKILAKYVKIEKFFNKTIFAFE